MATLPMFPLGSVLIPGMPLPLRIFEPRYRALFADVMAGDAEFGVVLIERGTEVGGGDQRFSRGTVAHVRGYRELESSIMVVATGGRRIEVERWLDDDPYPRAEVREIPPLTWSDDLAGMHRQAERCVRRLLATASEYVDVPWSVDEQLSDDPVVAAWQLAGIAPIQTLDRYALLGSTSLPELLERLQGFCAEADELIRLTAGPLEIDDD
ncbi:LON peptidase substrate-binding domain-containing protein [Microbacterium sp. HA-8]|jgi:Lon protease-like protein|uniref:LON peptidase substrate-binding domain-containing protein n=1 Tax=Microbacterium sp. HA-8 TaxID=3234200 RepID=UPI0038F678F3